MGVLTGLIGGAVAAGLGFYLRARPARAAQNLDGWFELRPRPVLHGALALGALMTALPTWILLTGGSTRPDAAEQNLWASVLLIGFGLMTVYLAWLTYGVRTSFHDGRLRVRSPLGTRDYPYADIVGLRKSVLTDELVVMLRGGRRLRFSHYFSGLDEFEESLVQSGVELFG